MRPFLRWLVNGRPKPTEPIVLYGEWSNPREDAILATAASLAEQTAMLGTLALLLERNAVATESMLAALDRAERRALEKTHLELEVT